MEFLSNINPSLVIEGGAVLVALVALYNNRKLQGSISTILGNHLKHIESNQQEDIDSRVKLATAVEKLSLIIKRKNGK